MHSLQFLFSVFSTSLFPAIDNTCPFSDSSLQRKHGPTWILILYMPLIFFYTFFYFSVIPYLLLKLSSYRSFLRNCLRSNCSTLFICNASYFLYHEVHLHIAARYNFFQPYHFGYNHVLSNNLIVHLVILHQN